MLNTEQKAWILPKCETLLGMAGDFTDINYDAVVAYTDKIYKQSKGNAEVKAILLETVTYIEHMDKILKGRR